MDNMSNYVTMQWFDSIGWVTIRAFSL